MAVLCLHFLIFTLSAEYLGMSYLGSLVHARIADVEAETILRHFVIAPHVCFQSDQ
jgi:hypothetical protein